MNTIKKADELELYQHLLNIARSGLPMNEALKKLAAECSGPLKEVSGRIASKIEQGERLSKALKDTGAGLNPYYIAMIKAGEESGNLPVVLYDTVMQYQRNLKAEHKILSNCRYPFVVVTVSSLLLIGIFIFVIPRLQDIFVRLNYKEYPFLTTVILEISRFFRHNWFVPIVIIAFFALLATNFWTIHFIKALRSWLELRLPFVSRMVYYQSLSTFSRGLSRMLHAGVPLPEALRLTGLTIHNNSFYKSIEWLAEEVEKGKKFSETLQLEPYFPEGIQWSIKIGEERGELEEILEETAVLYDGKFDDAADTAANWMEPILLLVIGSFTALILLGIYLPFFHLSDMLWLL